MQTGLWNQPMDLLFFALEIQKLRFSCAIKAEISKGAKLNQIEFFLNAASMREEELKLVLLDILSYIQGWQSNKRVNGSLI